MSCCAWITRQYCTLGNLRKPFMATRMLLNNFLVHGLACSMCYLYTSSERKFYYFCIQLDRVNPLGSPCPADEWDLCLFATFLANAVQYSTIKVYLLLSTAFLTYWSGLSKPLLNYLRFQRVLQGRCYGSHLKSLGCQHICKFWAARYLAYFGFLCSAEFTVPNLVSYLSAVHLGVAQVAIDSYSLPSSIQIQVKVSKTDLFRRAGVQGNFF